MKINPKSGIFDNDISHNDIEGSLLLNSNYYDLREVQNQTNALLSLLEQSKNLCASDPDYLFMLEELNDFLQPRPARIVIGLDEKLTNGNREDLIDEATYLEGKFSRLVSRGQFSVKDQVTYLYCLSKINTTFSCYVKPLFKKTVEPAIIDKILIEKVINPVFNDVSAVTVHITSEMVRGMIFFLTGKCHLKWE